MKKDEYTFHVSEIESVLDYLKTSEEGLSTTTANERLEEIGTNELAQVNKESMLTLFINQFKDFVILILIVASFISILFGELIDFIAILIILLLNAFLGFYQEYRAEKSIESLQSLTAPHARVFRDRVVTDVEARVLVPGDVILLEAGEVVPADCRLITSYNLFSDESTLTGESEPVHKTVNKLLDVHIDTSDQTNMLFMGTNIVKGSGRAVVARTGMDTKVGEITSMLSEAEDKTTPLKRKLNEFGVTLGWIILAICGFIVVLGTLSQSEITIDTFVNMLIVGVALAVAAIPEGLPAVVTVALSIGVMRMSKREAIIRNLGSVETLGSTTVICTDKTGTLTQNKMTVEKIAIAPFKDSLDPNQITSEHSKEPNIELLMTTAVCCNNSRMEETDDGSTKFKGDPTEIALLILGLNSGYNKNSIDKQNKRQLEFPFDSERKLMSTINSYNGKYYLFVKGAPDVVRERCLNIQNGNNLVELNGEIEKDLLASESEYSQHALRILAFAYKEISESDLNSLKQEEEIDYEKYEKDLTLIGLVGMKDPPRPEAITAIETAGIAGIRVMMITGDHMNTAVAIGRQMGLIGKSENEAEIALSGADLKGMSEEDLEEKVKSIKIFARVSPEHKLRIVTALQKNNEIVAMTGDGVNDAPALKRADIGVAMGLGGTDVATQASDMVLVDDNFATLEAAVEEGRSIFSNMKKFIGYLLACNAGEVLTIFLGIILLSIVAPGLPLEELLPLTALQLLYVNLLTDGLPALALGVDPKEPNVMKTPPRDPNESIFNVHMSSSILLAGMIVGLGTLLVFFSYLNIGIGYEGWVVHDASDKVIGGTIIKAQTMAFTVLIFFQKVMALSSRSEKDSLFTVGIFANKYLWGAILFTAFIHLLVIYLEPFQIIFGTVALRVEDWIIVLGLSISVFIAEEIRKFTFRHVGIN